MSVVDLAERRRALSAGSRRPEPARSGYRVVVTAPDGSTCLDVDVAGETALLPSADEADDVARALLEVVDVLEPGEWR